jgi:protein-disulfide isomerase
VIGGEVGRRNGYTLVEFMDYECPPCRTNSQKVQDIANLYNLQLVIRHLPLLMHRNAASAAAAAEAAREQGKFWKMHEALLKGGVLDAGEIKALAQKIGLNEKRFLSAWKGSAKKRASLDERVAEAIGLQGTPSFLLCTPKGEVWLLSNFEQINDLMKSNP